MTRARKSSEQATPLTGRWKPGRYGRPSSIFFARIHFLPAAVQTVERLLAQSLHSPPQDRSGQINCFKKQNNRLEQFNFASGTRWNTRRNAQMNNRIDLKKTAVIQHVRRSLPRTHRTLQANSLFCTTLLAEFVITEIRRSKLALNIGQFHRKTDSRRVC